MSVSARFSALNEHRANWNARSEQRKAILAKYGVEIEETQFGNRLKGGIADSWDRIARLEFNSNEGWQMATSGSIWKYEDAVRMAREVSEVMACIKELRAMGDTGGSHLSF